MAQRPRSGHETGPLEQGDLFSTDRIRPPDPSPSSEEADLTVMRDADLLARVPKANLTNVSGLCDAVLDRGLGDAAVGPLEALWHRFRGYGKDEALPEQRCALEALARVGTVASREALARIARATQPEGLLPHVLKAAVEGRLSLPLRQIDPWLRHRSPEVRVSAFRLVRKSNPSAQVLEEGYSDPYPSVRRAAFITAGLLGYASAKPGLLIELERNPTSQIIEALVLILDEDILVRLRRYALESETLRPVILDELRQGADPKAIKIAENIADQRDV